MDFCNKMDFLMKLTQIKNKELAAEMSVDRSLISLLRTGRRGIPQNKQHIRRMAESFAKRITADYQRQESLQWFAESVPQIEKHFETHTHIDICALHSVKEIKSGKVPIGSSYRSDENHPCYTPETYALHLKNILRLMDTYKGYTFIPISPESYPGYNLFVNDGGMAMLSCKRASETMLLEFHRPEVVMACKEHLLRIVDREGGTDGSRRRVKAELAALISELQKAAKSKS